jgi:uncharacterized membrane protein YdbT with pleckstrin-like domain
MIFGLTIPKFLGAILVGLILSGVLISLLVPHEVKPIVEQPKVVVIDPIMSDMAGIVSNMVMLTVLITIMAVVIGVFGRVLDGGRY